MQLVHISFLRVSQKHGFTVNNTDNIIYIEVKCNCLKFHLFRNISLMMERYSTLGIL